MSGSARARAIMMLPGEPIIHLDTCRFCRFDCTPRYNIPALNGLLLSYRRRGHPIPAERLRLAPSFSRWAISVAYSCHAWLLLLGCSSDAARLLSSLSTLMRLIQRCSYRSAKSIRKLNLGKARVRAEQLGKSAMAIAARKLWLIVDLNTPSAAIPSYLPEPDWRQARISIRHWCERRECAGVRVRLQVYKCFAARVARNSRRMAVVGCTRAYVPSSNDELLITVHSRWSISQTRALSVESTWDLTRSDEWERKRRRDGGVPRKLRTIVRQIYYTRLFNDFFNKCASMHRYPEESPEQICVTFNWVNEKNSYTTTTMLRY